MEGELRKSCHHPQTWAQTCSDNEQWLGNWGVLFQSSTGDETGRENKNESDDEVHSHCQMWSCVAFVVGFYIRARSCVGRFTVHLEEYDLKLALFFFF